MCVCECVVGNGKNISKIKKSHFQPFLSLSLSSIVALTGVLIAIPMIAVCRVHACSLCAISSPSTLLTWKTIHILAT